MRIVWRPPLAQQRRQQQWTAAWWLLPCLCTCWFATRRGGNAPCATPFAAFVALLYGSGLWAVSHAVAATLLTPPPAGQEPAAQTLRVWKMFHHVVVAAVTLGTLVRHCDNGMFQQGAVPGTSLQLTNLLYGVQFWTWSGLAVLDACLQSAATSQYALFAVHHALAIGLIGGSSRAGLHTAGALVLACMDASDVPLSMLKVVQAARSRWAAAALVPPLFAVFCVAWLAFRWVLYPVCLLWPGISKPWPAGRPPYEGTVLVGALLTLQVLNAVWSAQIMRMVMRGRSALLRSDVAVTQQAQQVGHAA